uniref:Candidate secreted effector n=1 Tax=Meloidogyne incognita TaxID=6306 RepID=A0A914LNP2_MELIC
MFQTLARWETPSEHPLEENPSTSGTKTKLSKKKRKQIKKTLDLNKGVDKDNKNEEEIVGNVVEGGVDLLEENEETTNIIVTKTDKLEESLTDHLPQNQPAEETPQESSSETTITEESTAGDKTKKSNKNGAKCNKIFKI